MTMPMTTIEIGMLQPVTSASGIAPSIADRRSLWSRRYAQAYGFRDMLLPPGLVMAVVFSQSVEDVSENARERVPPIGGGWWNVRHDSTHGGGFLDYRLDFHLSARRYEPGSIPTAQIRGLAAALDLLEEMGVESIKSRIRDSVRALAQGLGDLGWRIVSPEPLASGILAAVPPDGNPFRAATTLEARGVIVAPREGAVRFSPHAYNDLGEVERILAAISD